MAALYRICLTLAACVGVLGALPQTAAGQDSTKRIPDSTFRRLLGCGTLGPTLQKREATREVLQALSNVSSCPEGPDVIARLWGDVSGADEVYVRRLANVSLVTDHRVADALVQALTNRSLPTPVRLQALGAFLTQLSLGGAAEYGSEIEIVTTPGTVLTDLADQRAVPGGTRYVRFGQVMGVHSSPIKIDEAQRQQILVAIARVASDSSDDADMRMAAGAVHRRLLK